MHHPHAFLLHQHEPALVVLAVLICCLGVGASFALGREALGSQGARARLTWGAAGVVATTSTIWATHFISMLAYDPGLPYGVDIGRTLLSYVVALAMVGLGAWIAMAVQGSTGRLLGAATMGLAISAMHYTGMSAYQVQGRMSWDPGLVGSSIASGLALALLAGLAATARSWRLVLAGPVLFAGAIASDHFLGMAALSIEADTALAAPSQGVHRVALALLVANVAGLIVALSLAALWVATRNRRSRLSEEARLRELTDIAVEGLLICQGETVVSANRSIQRTLNCEASDFVGLTLGAVLPGLAVGRIPTTREVDAHLACRVAGPIPVRVIARPIASGGRDLVAIAVRDQRERLRSDSRMMRLAHEDSLTGLANRLSFTETLSGRFLLPQPGEESFALLMLDLDRFKMVNDTLGHGMGDELLRHVAARLGRAVPPGGVVARLGGDEFAILMGLGGDADGDLAPVRAVAEAVIDLLGRPFLIDGNIIDVGTSIGVALAPADGDEPAELSRSADLALYRAKQEGGSCWRLYEPEMIARIRARRSLELDLRRALSRQEFVVFYQPQVDARTGAFAGAEALVRWRHPERGMVSPAEFIPLAEEIGLIGGIGEWVLRTACTDALAWPAHVTVAVNLSPVQFRDARLCATIKAILAETGLPGSRLELEVTESALLQDDGTTQAVLQALHDLGIAISMDDFGTGYSSLSYLRRFPFDKIKIDRSFIAQVPNDADSVAIVQAITSLGPKLGLTVTVEGVETDEQRAFSVMQGCDQIQGYLVSRPVPAERLLEIFGADLVVDAVA